MMMQTKAKLIIVAIIMANLMFANFASAQKIEVLQQLLADGQTDKTKCEQLNNILKEQTIGLTAGKRMDVTEQYYGTRFIEGLRNTGLPGPVATSCHVVKYEDGKIVSASMEATQLSNILKSASTEIMNRELKELSLENNAKNIAGNAVKAGVLGIANTIASILALIVGAVTSGVLVMTAIAGNFLSLAVDYTVSLQAPEVVDIGWRVIRDLMNLLFILALIAISIGTILRIESYNYKKILPKLILMALLINFSKVIATTLIDFAGILIQIARGNEPWLKDYYSNFVSIVQFYSHKNGILQYLTESGGLSDLVLSITGLVLAVIMGVSFMAVAALLVIRIVGLWVLTIFSPIAYALDVLPATSSYAKQWWKKFFDYLIWAPVSVFMLHLGSIILKDGAVSNKFSGENSIFFFIIVMAFMWAAVIVAKQAGMVGSGAIISMAEKGAKWGSSAALKYGLRGTAVKHAGMGLEKLSGGRVTALKQIGEKWQSGAQYVEGAPGTVKGLLDKSEAAYQKGVKSKQQGVFRKFGFVDTGKDALGDLEAADVDEIMRQELAKTPDKVNLEKIRKIVTDAPEQSLNGILRHMNAIPASHQQLKDVVEQNLWRRMGGSGIAQHMTYAPTPSGTIEVSGGGLPAGTTRSYNTAAFNHAFEYDLMDERQKRATDERLAKLHQTEMVEKSLKDSPNPDLASKIVKEQAEGRLLSAGELANAKLERDALARIGQRVDVAKAQVSRSGNEIIIGNAVAEKMGLKTDATLRNNNDAQSQAEIERFAQALKEEGVADAEISKVVNNFNTVGSVAIQKGSFAPLSHVLEENATPEQKQIVRTERRDMMKQAEHNHGLYHYVKRSNSSDYGQMISQVKGDQKFAELSQKMRTNSAYAGASDDQIAEEILERKHTREQLSPQVRQSVDNTLNRYRPAWRNDIKKAGTSSGVVQRAEQLKEVVLMRAGGDKEVSNSASRAAAGAIRSSAEQLKTAASEMSGAAKDLKSNVVQQKNFSQINNQNLKSAATAIKGAATSERKAAETINESAQNLNAAAEELGSAAARPQPNVSANPSMTRKDIKNLNNNLKDFNDSNR